MIQIGRLCLKTTGRDAGLHCVILTEIKDNHVLIDGETRRRKCNIKHLEPLPTIVKISPEANHKEVAAVLSQLKITVRETKPRKTLPRQLKLRRSKLAEKKPSQNKTSTTKTKMSMDKTSVKTAEKSSQVQT